MTTIIFFYFRKSLNRKKNIFFFLSRNPGRISSKSENNLFSFFFSRNKPFSLKKFFIEVKKNQVAIFSSRFFWVEKISSYMFSYVLTLLQDTYAFICLLPTSETFVNILELSGARLHMRNWSLHDLLEHLCHLRN